MQMEETISYVRTLLNAGAEGRRQTIEQYVMALSSSQIPAFKLAAEVPNLLNYVVMAHEMIQISRRTNGPELIDATLRRCPSCVGAVELLAFADFVGLKEAKDGTVYNPNLLAMASFWRKNGKNAMPFWGYWRIWCHECDYFANDPVLFTRQPADAARRRPLVELPQCGGGGK